MDIHFRVFDTYVPCEGCSLHLERQRRHLRSNTRCQMLAARSSTGNHPRSIPAKTRAAPQYPRTLTSDWGYMPGTVSLSSCRKRDEGRLRDHVESPDFPARCPRAPSFRHFPWSLRNHLLVPRCPPSRPLSPKIPHGPPRAVMGLSLVHDFPGGLNPPSARCRLSTPLAPFAKSCIYLPGHGVFPQTVQRGDVRRCIPWFKDVGQHLVFRWIRRSHVTRKHDPNTKRYACLSIFSSIRASHHSSPCVRRL